MPAPSDSLIKPITSPAPALLTDVSESGFVTPSSCVHCGEPCRGNIVMHGLPFCCEGCRQVYVILNETDACTPSMMQQLKNIQPKGRFKTDKWDYLDVPEIADKLVSFKSSNQVHILLKLPNIHCSSCIWLIEHLDRIHKGVIKSTVDFDRKEAVIIFNPQSIKLSEIAALLDYIGYAPAINHSSSVQHYPSTQKRSTILRIGVAGFCFSNIMMLSFPDYLADQGLGEELLKTAFSWISLLLALPVLFYAAAPFFTQAWKGLRQRFLNIDAPIALAILIAFGRSVYEILSHQGNGYLDSMSGIVFFMLLGRWFQERTQHSLSFDRDYRSWFPMSALVRNPEGNRYIPIEKLETGQTLIIRNQELVPADGILQDGNAWIDYSFVSGEKDPVHVSQGEMLYAGGKQTGTAIAMKVTKPVTASHLTRLWNNEAFHNTKNKEASFVHPWSNYFTIVLFSIAIASAFYWQQTNPANTWKAVTAVLLVACPCSLLLSATFTFGNLMRKLSRNRLYLKNANVIERIAEADTVVFDKTGTLTSGAAPAIRYIGKALGSYEHQAIRHVASHSNHPLSRALADWEGWNQPNHKVTITNFQESPGKGITATCNGIDIRLGRPEFVGDACPTILESTSEGSSVHFSINGKYRGRFMIIPSYREGVFNMMQQLASTGMKLHVVSGDNPREAAFLKSKLGDSSQLQFNTSPEGKLAYIKSLQDQGHKVLMVGDGLNDAGALQQSDAGIAITDNANCFTPACDAILDGQGLHQLSALIQLTRTGKKVVAAGFILSILYNLVGMYFATQALLSPMIAAILMPASTISIIAVSYMGIRVQKT